VKVDGRAVTVSRLSPDWSGRLVPTTMLQACEAAGVRVPHYCYHAQLPVAGNCRMCLVEYGTPSLGPDRQPVRLPDGSPIIQKSPRPAIACATPLTPGMEIYTETEGVKRMREGVLEFLLINHPLDCPICDQAGECKLQEYSVEYGQTTSRFVETKVHKPKEVDLGLHVLLDDERCILCTRCIRFTRDIVGDDALGIVNRGSYNTLTNYPGRPFANHYTLNTVDLCPVGALTSKDFRFRMRVWFLKETPSLCTSCATGCNVVIGSRENRILRLTPRANYHVNRCWLCDPGRLNYRWIQRDDRLKDVHGPAGPLPWSAALAELTAKLRSAAPGSIAVIASARQTNEELYLLNHLARKFDAITDCVPRMGDADRFLIHADKNPNTTGARLLGITGTQPGGRLQEIAQGVRDHRIRTLIVFGEEITRLGFEIDHLNALDLLVVSDILPNATTALADYLLPGCAHAEKRGSLTNAAGRVQRFQQAVQPPGDARPEWEFLGSLVTQVTGEAIPETIEGLFNRMARDTPAFRGMTWAGLGDHGTAITDEGKRTHALD
jgi:NADH-quinone oxidoreductase subunit G